MKNLHLSTKSALFLLLVAFLAGCSGFSLYESKINRANDPDSIVSLAKEISTDTSLSADDKSVLLSKLGDHTISVVRGKMNALYDSGVDDMRSKLQEIWEYISKNKSLLLDVKPQEYLSMLHDYYLIASGGGK